MNELPQITLPSELAQIAENVSLEKRSEVQNVLNHVFIGVGKMRSQLETVVVADENDKINMKLANTIRLGIRQVRLDAEKTFDAKRNEVQAQMLSFKTEDQLWLKAKQTMQILTKEIEEQARWKEETRERYEAEQKKLRTQQRMVKVSKFSSEIMPSEFEHMTDQGFDLFLSALEKQYIDRIEAERKAEEEKVAKEKAEAEERARIKAENEKLRIQAELKEKQLAQEKAKAAAERKAFEDKARKEKEAADAKLRAEAEARARAEAELKAKADSEARAKRDAEAKAAAELRSKQEAERKAKSAPDKEKLILLANSLSKIEMPELKTDQAKSILSDVQALLLKISNHILSKSELL
jgi:hypothetical protein